MAAGASRGGFAAGTLNVGSSSSSSSSAPKTPSSTKHQQAKATLVDTLFDSLMYGTHDEILEIYHHNRVRCGGAPSVDFDKDSTDPTLELMARMSHFSSATQSDECVERENRNKRENERQ